MNADSAFYIGKTHHVCEDYCGHGISKKGMPFAIVSDGCSSSPDTDFGSRFLVKSTQNCYQHIAGFIVHDHIIAEAATNAKWANVEETSVDATLLTAEVCDDEFSISCAGDGVIARIKKNGEIDVSEITYDSGAPYYLSYGLSPERNEEYKKKFGLKRTIRNYSITNACKGKETILKDESGLPYFEQKKIGDYIALAIMSDGVLSYQQPLDSLTTKMHVPVESYKVIAKLLSFKNYNGIFVQRRFLKFRKDCDQLGWFSLDDVSIGAIYLGE